MSASDDEEETHCPLCVEEMDLSDRNFLPCPCGYRVCMWCWHHIRENLNGLCPACRTPYNPDPHAFSAVDRQEIVRKNRERRQKEKAEKKTTDKPPTFSRSEIKSIADRKQLHNYRVVQRNLVYIIGLPAVLTSEDAIRKPEYFGQYGKIGKVVIHKNQSAAHTTISAYVTFVYKDDAKAAIQALEGFWVEGHLLRASFGTTKYCNNFIRGMPCNNPECVYLHELGEDEDRFTKEEIQAGHSKLVQNPGKDQTIVTGMGGPSGTGKRPAGEPVLPPPVFLQDIGGGPAMPRSASRATSWNVSSEGGTTTAATAGNNQKGGGGLPPVELSPMPSPPTPDASSLMRAESPPSISPLPEPVAAVAVAETPTVVEGAAAGSGSLLVTPFSAIQSASAGKLQQQVATSNTTIVTRSGGAVVVEPPAAEVTAGSRRLNQDSKNESKDQIQTNNKPFNDGIAAVPQAAAAPVEADDSDYDCATNSYADGLAGLQPVVYPGRSEAQQQQAVAATFNGLGRCAVFPVPVTSITVSIWSPILKASSSTSLEINPFGKLLLPVSELLDLTLPPVDAVSMSPWPKPLEYYRQGAGADGSTHTYAGRHIHHVTDNGISNNSSSGGGISSQQQQHMGGGGSEAAAVLQHLQQGRGAMQERAENYAAHLQQLQMQNGVPAGPGGLTAQQIMMMQKQRQLEHQHLVQQHQLGQQTSMGGGQASMGGGQASMGGGQASMGGGHNGSSASDVYAIQQQQQQQLQLQHEQHQAQLQLQQRLEAVQQQQQQAQAQANKQQQQAGGGNSGGGGGGIPSISILQQMFPTVKMTYGAPTQKR